MKEDCIYLRHFASPLISGIYVVQYFSPDLVGLSLAGWCSDPPSPMQLACCSAFRHSDSGATALRHFRIMQVIERQNYAAQKAAGSK